MADLIIEKEVTRYDTPRTRLAQFIWGLLSVVQTLLALRFILRLFGANPNACFTDFIYNITQPLSAPFARVPPASELGRGVIDRSIILATIIYWLIAYLLVWLVSMSPPVAR